MRSLYHYPTFDYMLYMYGRSKTKNICIHELAVLLEGDFKGTKVVPFTLKGDEMPLQDILAWLLKNKIDVVKDHNGFYKKQVTEDELFLIKMSFPLRKSP